MSLYEIPACAGKPYIPSNGTEGEAFQYIYCDRCARDAKYRETEDGADGCPILLNALCYDVSDEKYPSEWTHDERGRPTCTAFESER